MSRLDLVQRDGAGPRQVASDREGMIELYLTKWSRVVQDRMVARQFVPPARWSSRVLRVAEVIMDDSPIPDFTVALLTAVLVMDAEATPTAKGEMTGLNYYGRYRHPEQRRPQTEPCWSERLVELLGTAGYQVRNECGYPGDANSPRAPRCDNVITFEDGRTLWLENKGAWKDYWVSRGALAKFRSHLLTSNNSAAHDVRKLERLHGTCADFVGFLLIGFEAVDDPMTAEFREFVNASGVGKARWNMASLDFPDRWRSGHRVRVWFFSRPAEDATISSPDLDPSEEGHVDRDR